MKPFIVLYLLGHAHWWSFSLRHRLLMHCMEPTLAANMHYDVIPEGKQPDKINGTFRVEYSSGSIRKTTPLSRVVGRMRKYCVALYVSCMAADTGLLLPSTKTSSTETVHGQKMFAYTHRDTHPKGTEPPVDRRTCATWISVNHSPRSGCF